jgi:hypothetical protein
MNTRLFADLFTIIVISYWAGCWAYSFGSWLGWVMDPEQWPRVMVALLVDLFRWDRQVSREINDLDACVDAMTADMQKGQR